MSKQKHSGKRQVVVGHETYMNQKTGEVIECEVISVEDRDFNFDKVWAFWLAQTLDLIGNSKVQVLTFLMENRDRQNRVVSTQRKLAEDIGVSLTTVSKTLKALQEIDAIRSPQSGVYVINPEFIFKGRHDNRMRVLMEYKKSSTPQSLNEDIESDAAAE